KIVIAAWAGVVHPKNAGDYEGPWVWTTLWGIGNISGKKYDTIHNYTVQACANQPPPPPPPPVPTGGGVITITFDDGFNTTYQNVNPVLRDLGLRGSVAVNPTPIDEGWGDYMTLAQVKELHAAGWSVVSHSMTHRDLTTLSAAELDKE